MQYLCIETSTTSGFVSLFEKQTKKLEYRWKEGLHSEKLIESLHAFQLQPKTLKFIAVSAGPGRFTGIRVGVQFAKTLAYALSCPIYLCSSLRLMAEPLLQEGEKPVLCLTDAFGNMFYAGIYQKIKTVVQVLLQPSALTLESLESQITEPVFCVGNAYKRKCHLFSKPFKKNLETMENMEVSPESFSKTVLSEWKEDHLKSWTEAEPLYLRTPGN